jgi:hypothetical protein
MLSGGFIIGFSVSQWGLLPLTRVSATVQHLFFNSVRIGNSQPQPVDFFATGDLLVSRRTFTTDLVAGALTDTDGTTTSGKLRLRDERGRDLIEATAAGNQGGSIEVRGADGAATVQISGGASGGSIQLNGRALDYAEVFAVRDQAKVEPGHVVTIDPQEPGRLTLSTRAYDRGVAGVIAGADGLRSGIVLGTRSDDSHQPVALNGRVYCWVDAGYGLIKPGDLLTTSPTAGHAMRVSDLARAQGAILGKAMQGLSQGRGKILVLVNLQ